MVTETRFLTTLRLQSSGSRAFFSPEQEPGVGRSSVLNKSREWAVLQSWTRAGIRAFFCPGQEPGVGRSSVLNKSREWGVLQS
jgi:hypothetical protein